MTVDRRAQARAALVDIEREHGTERWIEARGDSMRPLIRPGDRILVAIGARPQRLGQVVVVQRDRQSVAHRIVGTRPHEPEASWVTKGDAEAFADALVATAEVIGVVLGVERPGGTTHRRGFEGRLARLIARSSALGGAIAWHLRRIGRRLPERPAALALRFLLPMTRVPTRLIAAPIPWFDRETPREGR